jgi:hypothetical protein
MKPGQATATGSAYRRGGVFTRLSFSGAETLIQSYSLRGAITTMASWGLDDPKLGIEMIIAQMDAKTLR